MRPFASERQSIADGRTETGIITSSTITTSISLSAELITIFEQVQKICLQIVQLDKECSSLQDNDPIFIVSHIQKNEYYI